VSPPGLPDACLQTPAVGTVGATEATELGPRSGRDQCARPSSSQGNRARREFRPSRQLGSSVSRRRPIEPWNRLRLAAKCLAAACPLKIHPAGAEFSSCPGDKPKSRLYATTALCCGLSAESAFAAMVRNYIHTVLVHGTLSSTFFKKGES
jgi:hypothetical protein